MRIEDNGKHIIANEGKVFKCVCHDTILGSEVFLREIMKDGVLVEDTPENYVEVDEPARPEDEMTE